MSKSIIFAILFVSVVSLGYLGFQKIYNRPTKPSITTIPKPSPSNVDHLSPQEEAPKVAEKFLTLVKQQQGKEVLALFTPTETAKEADSYSFLAGLDIVGPRVFSIANLNFHLLSADIVSIVKNDDGTFLVNVKEKRRTFDNTSPKNFDKIEQTVIVLKTIGWNWYVDKYFYRDDTLAVENKYNALYPRN